MVTSSTLGFDMKSAALFVTLLCALGSAPALADLDVVIVEGIGGDARYAGEFSEQIAVIEAAARTVTSDARLRTFRHGEFTRDDILDYFETLRARLSEQDQLAVYLIGHGSYDEHHYKFNIAGPDLVDDDLVSFFDAINVRNALLVNTGSSSGALAEQLGAADRTLILGTRSGAERHATRFGRYFSAALTDASADIDKNDIITAAEAFEFANRQVTDYFERNGTLATEHPLLAGEQANRLTLSRLTTLAINELPGDDEVLADLLRQRDSLNTEIDAHRLSRESTNAADYQATLLQQMISLAELEEAIERRRAETSGDVSQERPR